MQIHIRPFKTVDAAELQSAVLESVGHIGPWLDWATPRYSLTDARDWVSESRTLWARQSTYRWLITDAQSRSIYGSVEISRQLLGGKVGRMGYWLRRQALGKGICSRAGKAALNYVFHRGLFEQVDLYIDPANEPSLAVARKLGAQLQGERADEISYRGEARPALHFAVTPDRLASPKESSSRPGSIVQVHVSGGFSANQDSDGSVYEFRRSVKNARL
ncbi:MAG: GNAT family N-acetyltransferase [Pseudomonadales bacterium]|nr:GNAT family N-acetyltransferase [Pseudomonadales bacterium]